MRGRVGFRGALVWLAIYIAIGTVAWFTVWGVIQALLAIGMVTVAWLASSDWLLLTHFGFALAAWAGGSVIAAFIHRRAWLAGVGPVVALLVGGALAEVILTLAGADPFRWLNLARPAMCAAIPAMLLVPYCVAIAAMRQDDLMDGVCWRCGYSMAGLTGRVCPECGASVANDSGNASM